MTFTENEITQYLMQCDLTENDAKVYLWLLKNKISNPSDIAKGTGIQRPRVYDSLKRLMDRGFVIQDIEKKRPDYMVTDSRLLVKDLERQIRLKKEACERIKEKLIEQPPISTPKGIFFFNTDDSLRLEIQKLVESAKKSLQILAVFPGEFKEEGLFSPQMLSNKSQEGLQITLLLNINPKNWEDCLNLFTNKVQIYHYPLLKQISVLFHLIDNEIICLSAYKYEKNRVWLDYGIIFRGVQSFIDAFEFLLQGFIKESISIKDRIEELKKSIIFPTNTLKDIFGIKE